MNSRLLLYSVILKAAATFVCMMCKSVILAAAVTVFGHYAVTALHRKSELDKFSLSLTTLLCQFDLMFWDGCVEPPVAVA